MKTQVSLKRKNFISKHEKPVLQISSLTMPIRVEVRSLKSIYHLPYISLFLWRTLTDTPFLVICHRIRKMIMPTQGVITPNVSQICILNRWMKNIYFFKILVKVTVNSTLDRNSSFKRENEGNRRMMLRNNYFSSLFCDFQYNGQG